MTLVSNPDGTFSLCVKHGRTTLDLSDLEDLRKLVELTYYAHLLKDDLSQELGLGKHAQKPEKATANEEPPSPDNMTLQLPEGFVLP